MPTYLRLDCDRRQIRVSFLPLADQSPDCFRTHTEERTLIVPQEAFLDQMGELAVIKALGNAGVVCARKDVSPVVARLRSIGDTLHNDFIMHFKHVFRNLRVGWISSSSSPPKFSLTVRRRLRSLIFLKGLVEFPAFDTETSNFANNDPARRHHQIFHVIFVAEVVCLSKCNYDDIT